ncbi:MAG: DUF2523 family protein [Polaromonas sp.]|nr:DUF2523 family protein [Polaromonas sp.]
MPWFASIFIGGLLQLVGSFIGRAVIALGFGFIEYQGISAMIDSAKSSASSMLGAVGSSSLAAWAGFFRVDVHLSIILSAIGVKVLLNALGGASVRRMVQK